MFKLRTILGSKGNIPQNNMLTVHMDDQLAHFRLSTFLSESLQEISKENLPLVMCIGTDRSTGDSLGPLTGWQLIPLLKPWGLPVYGTLEDPVHAVNLADTIQAISKANSTRPIIAVDACLGQVSPVGSIIVKKEPLQPGIGLKKTLPAIGDISISGIVNVGGYMDFQVLQNTRLSLVFKMSQTIANCIFLAVQNTYPQLKLVTSND